LHYGKPVPAPCHTITAERRETLTSFVPMAARALYSYSAAIPEELSFSKGDVLAVLRLQDDGWWEAQIEKGRQGVRMVGLVPSNYLQRI
jgi:SH3 domain